MKKNFFFTGIIFILSVITFYTAIHSIDPLGPQKGIAMVAFFSSLFLGISSLFTFVFFFGAETILNQKLGQKAFFISMRRGIITGIFVCLLFLLQLLRILDFFEIILIGSFLILVEFIFASNRNKPPS